MASPADFSQLLDLMDVKRLYEEQQEKWNMRLAEKDERLERLMQEVNQLREMATLDGGNDDEVKRLEDERTRVAAEAEVRIQQLNQRLAELNQKLGVAPA